MAEPFVFHFKPGPGGRPEIMYICDIRAECGLCKHPQIQRFYHATDFHRLTLEGMASIAVTAHTKTGYECENCGEAVTPDHALAAVTTFGFADDAGLIRVFHSPADHSSRIQIVARRRMDPQELPGWQPDDQLPIFDALIDFDVEEKLDRAVNPKQAWMQLIEEFRENGDEAWVRLGRGMVVFVAENDDALEALIDDAFDLDSTLAQDETLNDALVVSLDNAVPDALGTHDDPQRMFGAVSTWLSPEQRADLGKRYVTAALVSGEVVEQTLARAFDVARLRFDRVEEDEDVWYRALTTPGDISYSRDLSVEAILRRAVYTGITPGESARLTAEEVIGVLLRVWIVKDEE